MFAIKYALARVYRNPIASIVTILLVALTSATIMLATSIANSLQATEQKAMAPLAELGADIAMVRQLNGSEPEHAAEELANGIHRKEQLVLYKDEHEDTDYIISELTTLGVPVGIANRFTTKELDDIDRLPGISSQSSLLLASYSSLSNKEKKIILPEENFRPQSFNLDPDEDRALLNKIKADPTIKRMVAEQKKLFEKPEQERTDEDANRLDQLVEKLGRREMELRHKYRPDIFGAPPKRSQKVIEPEPPIMTSIEHYVAGMEPGVGYLKKEDIVKGRYFTEADVGSETAILRADFAQKNKLSVGSAYKLIDVEYRVIGIAWPSLAINSPEVFVPLDTLQKQLNAEGVVNVVFIRARSGDETAGLKDALARRFPDARLSDNSELTGMIKPAVQGSMAVLVRFSQVLSLILLASAVGTIALLGSNLASKRSKEIAILRAIGWSRGRVSAYISMDTAVKVAIGTAIGISAGVIAAGYLDAGTQPLPRYKSYASSNFFYYFAGQTSSKQVSTVFVPLDYTISLITYLRTIGAATLIAAVAGLAVVRRVVRVKPAVVLRRP